jgi:hypothetical protein
MMSGRMKARLLMAAVALIAVPSIGAELPPIYTTGDATVCFTTGNTLKGKVQSLHIHLYMCSDCTYFNADG